MKVEAADGLRLSSPPDDAPAAATPDDAKGPDLWKRLWPWLAAAASGGLLTLCLSPWDQQWLCWLALTPLTAALWAEGRPRRGDGGHTPGTRAGAGSVGCRRAGGALSAWGTSRDSSTIWGAFYWIWVVTRTGLGSCSGFTWLATWPCGACSWRWSPGPGTFPVPAETDWMRRPPAAARRSSIPCLSPLGRVADPAFALEPVVRLPRVRPPGWQWNGCAAGCSRALAGMTSARALHANLPFIQIAEWTGVGGVSFLAVFVNVILVATVRRFALGSAPAPGASAFRFHADHRRDAAGVYLRHPPPATLRQTGCRQPGRHPAVARRGGAGGHPAVREMEPGPCGRASCAPTPN